MPLNKNFLMSKFVQIYWLHCVVFSFIKCSEGESNLHGENT